MSEEMSAMYHEPAMSGVSRSITAIRPPRHDPGTSMAEVSSPTRLPAHNQGISLSNVSTPIRPSELEPVTPSRLPDSDNESPGTGRQTDPATARSSRQFKRSSPNISVSGYYVLLV